MRIHLYIHGAVKRGTKKMILPILFFSKWAQQLRTLGGTEAQEAHVIARSVSQRAGEAEAVHSGCLDHVMSEFSKLACFATQAGPLTTSLLAGPMRLGEMVPTLFPRMSHASSRNSWGRMWTSWSPRQRCSHYPEARQTGCPEGWRAPGAPGEAPDGSCCSGV